MRRHLLRSAMVLGIAALALSFTGLVLAQGTSNAPAPAPATTPAPAPAPKPKRQQYTGAVTAIDAKAGSLIVKKGEESKTFKIGEKTKYSTVEKTKGTAAVTDIKVGDKITVHFVDEDGVLVAHSVGVPQSVKKQESAQ
jgi:Cu/Ag efflux protein CusF